MTLKTPLFWYRPPNQKPGIVEEMLMPLSALYRLGYEIHQATGRREKFPVPIICIGNINAGGTGKTPTALAIMDLIRKNGLAQNPFFMSRGYGGGEIGPLLVDPEKHTAWHTGDEPLILASYAPTIVAASRADGITFAIRKNADLVLMDDGLQNPHIARDIKIVVINGDMGFGNGRMIPSGPLREPLQKGLKKADAFIFIGNDTRNTKSILPADKPCFTTSLQLAEPPPPGRYFAFAGIGYPQKFFNFLRDSGINEVGTESFADHYPFTAEDIARLRQKATAANAELITTEKDYMRLPDKTGIHALRTSLSWDNAPALVKFLQERLNRS